MSGSSDTDTTPRSRQVRPSATSSGTKSSYRNPGLIEGADWSGTINIHAAPHKVSIEFLNGGEDGVRITAVDDYYKEFVTTVKWADIEELAEDDEQLLPANRQELAARISTCITMGTGSGDSRKKVLMLERPADGSTVASKRKAATKRTDEDDSDAEPIGVVSEPEDDDAAVAERMAHQVDLGTMQVMYADHQVRARSLPDQAIGFYVLDDFDKPIKLVVSWAEIQSLLEDKTELLRPLGSEPDNRNKLLKKRCAALAKMFTYEDVPGDTRRKTLVVRKKETKKMTKKRSKGLLEKKKSHGRGIAQVLRSMSDLRPLTPEERARKAAIAMLGNSRRRLVELEKLPRQDAAAAQRAKRYWGQLRKNLGKLLDKDPLVGRLRKGYSQFRKWRWASAAENLQAAADGGVIEGRGANPARLWRCLGRAQYETWRRTYRAAALELAHAAYNNALQHMANVASVECWMECGLTYLRYGAWAGAAQVFARIMVDFPRYGQANYVYFYAAVALLYLKQIDKAINYIRALIPQPPEPYNEIHLTFIIGRWHQMAGRQQQAVEAFQDVHRTLRNAIGLHAAVGAAFGDSAQVSASRATSAEGSARSHISTLSGDDGSVRRMKRSQTMKGQGLRRATYLDDAEVHEVLEITDGLSAQSRMLNFEDWIADPDTWEAFGDIFAVSRDFPISVDLYAQAMRHSDSPSVHLVHMVGRGLAAIQERDQAMRMLEVALKMAKDAGIDGKAEKDEISMELRVWFPEHFGDVRFREDSDSDDGAYEQKRKNRRIRKVAGLDVRRKSMSHEEAATTITAAARGKVQRKRVQSQRGDLERARDERAARRERERAERAEREAAETRRREEEEAEARRIEEERHGKEEADRRAAERAREVEVERARQAAAAEAAAILAASDDDGAADATPSPQHASPQQAPSPQQRAPAAAARPQMSAAELQRRRNDAAVGLQKVVRGRQGRTKAARKKSELTYKERAELEAKRRDEMAQRARARQKARENARLAEMSRRQRILNSRAHQVETDRRQTGAATRIQAIQRGRRDRRKVDIMKSMPSSKEAHRSATRIQAVHRGRRGRNRVDGIKHLNKQKEYDAELRRAQEELRKTEESAAYERLAQQRRERELALQRAEEDAKVAALLGESPSLDVLETLSAAAPAGPSDVDEIFDARGRHPRLVDTDPEIEKLFSLRLLGVPTGGGVRAVASRYAEFDSSYVPPDPTFFVALPPFEAAASSTVDAPHSMTSPQFGPGSPSTRSMDYMPVMDTGRAAMAALRSGMRSPEAGRAEASESPMLATPVPLGITSRPSPGPRVTPARVQSPPAAVPNVDDLLGGMHTIQAGSRAEKWATPAREETPSPAPEPVPRGSAAQSSSRSPSRGRAGDTGPRLRSPDGAGARPVRARTPSPQRTTRQGRATSPGQYQAPASKRHLAFLEGSAEAEAGFVRHATVETARRRGYAGSNSKPFLRYWRDKLRRSLSLYGNLAEARLYIAEVRTAHPSVTNEEAFCALADCDVDVRVAKGRLSDAAFLREVRSVCRAVDVNAFIDGASKQRARTPGVPLPALAPLADRERATSSGEAGKAALGSTSASAPAAGDAASRTAGGPETVERPKGNPDALPDVHASPSRRGLRGSPATRKGSPASRRRPGTRGRKMRRGEKSPDRRGVAGIPDARSPLLPPSLLSAASPERGARQPRTKTSKSLARLTNTVHRCNRPDCVECNIRRAMTGGD